ncbi:MAG: hypothetical protein ACR2P9_09230 [Gammaproteobacteria bacterium]
MRNITHTTNLLIFMLTMAIVWTWSSPSVANIVCDEFEIKHQVSGDELNLSLLTDLPDDMVVMVSVYRTYRNKDNPETDYLIDYFDEKSTAGQWRIPKRILIGSQQFTALVNKKQKELSRLGLWPGIASIADDITISMVVPINKLLTGKATEAHRIGTGRIVYREIKIRFPLNDDANNVNSLPSLDPNNLDVGAMYVVSKKTPLMPSHSPTDSFKTIAEMVYIPKGGIIKILDTWRDPKIQRRWYKVEVLKRNGQSLGAGWVNSVALIGQNLKATM